MGGLTIEEDGAYYGPDSDRATSKQTVCPHYSSLSSSAGPTGRGLMGMW